MQEVSFEQALDAIQAKGPRYHREAYLFVREALDFTCKNLKKPQRGAQRHVSASELLDGIRQYAMQEYGAMAKTVLNRWGVHTGEDFGNIVFNLVEKGILGKTEQDRREDFLGGYDFDQAYRQPYRPGKKARSVTQKRPESAGSS